MKTFTHVINDALGIHARPAGLLVKLVKGYSSKVTLFKDDKSVDMTKLMMLMGMGVKCGEEVKVTIEGPDEDTVVTELENFFTENL